MRNLRVFGLAFVAAVALSAVAASAAFATYDIEAPSEAAAKTSTISGAQVEENIFFTAAGTVECEEATFAGTGAGMPVDKGDGFWTFPEVTVTPTYNKCTAFGQNGTVNTNGCHYTFAAATTTEPAGTTDSNVTITCPGAPITVTAGACTVTVGSQGPINHVMFTNNGSGSTADVLATAEATGIHYTSSGCAGNTTHTDGEYIGTVTLKGHNVGGTQVGIEVT